MRKALLVVTLILASFGGGAFVNGPGLVWLKGLMGLEPRPVENLGGEPPPAFDEPPAVSVGPEPTAPEPPEPADALASSPPAETEPAKPQSLALAEPESPPLPDLVPSSDPSTPPTDPDSPSPPPLEPPTQARSEPQPVTLDPVRPGIPTRQTSPASTPPRPALAGPGAPPSENEPGWGDAPGSAPATAILPKPRTTQTRQDPQISGASLASQPTSEPEASPSPAPAPSRSPAPPASDSAWDALKQAMTARGVTRFWAEGEPSGSVTFRCVVPLAGRGAIAQQFEAQGDNVLSAAEATLKRIDLWKATEKK